MFGSVVFLCGCASVGLLSESLSLCSFPGGASAGQERDLWAFGVAVLPQDFACALEQLQNSHAQAIGAPKVPPTRTSAA